MKFLLLAVLILLLTQFASGYFAARRHNVSFGRVLDAQVASFKRAFVLLVYALIAAPALLHLLGVADYFRADNTRALVLYYVMCVGCLWVARAWPFRSSP